MVVKSVDGEGGTEGRPNQDTWCIRREGVRKDKRGGGMQGGRGRGVSSIPTMKKKATGKRKGRRGCRVALFLRGAPVGFGEGGGKVGGGGAAAAAAAAERVRR